MFTPLWLMVATVIYFIVAVKATIEYKKSTRFDPEFDLFMFLLFAGVFCYLFWPILLVIGPAYLIGTFISNRKN
jgi:chromate transport protein ChrA